MTLITLEQCEGGGNIVILAFHSQGHLPPFQYLLLAFHLQSILSFIVRDKGKFKVRMAQWVKYLL